MRHARHPRVPHELTRLKSRAPLGYPICNRAVLTVPHFLILFHLENARCEYFEDVNNSTLKSLSGDRAPINKLVAYVKSEKHMSV